MQALDMRGMRTRMKMPRTNMWSDASMRGSQRKDKVKMPEGQKAARRADNQKSGPNGSLDFQFEISYLYLSFILNLKSQVHQHQQPTLVSEQHSTEKESKVKLFITSMPIIKKITINIKQIYNKTFSAETQSKEIFFTSLIVQ